MAYGTGFAEVAEVAASTSRCDIDGAVRALSRADLGVEERRALARGLCPAGGVVVRANEDGSYQVADTDAHTIAVAKTRGGKSRRHALPMLRSIILSGASSLVVNDPKGELLEGVRDLLGPCGYRTLVLDFRDPDASPDAYNPLALAWDLWHGGSTDEAVQSLIDFATCLNAKMDARTSDAYWPMSSNDYFVGLAMLLLELGAEREEFHVGSVARLDEVGADDNRGSLRRLADSCGEGLSREKLAEALSAAGDTYRSIRSVFRGSVSRYVGMRSLAGMTATSTFSCEDLVRERCALFVESDDCSSSLAPVVVGILDQIVTRVVHLGQRSPGGCLPRRVDVVLDEFGNMRAPLNDLDMLLAAACGRGVRLHLMVQSMSQIDHVYGADMRTVALDNIEQWVYLGSRSLETNRYFSEMLGTVAPPPTYEERPLLDVATLQRLERREDASEAVVLIGSLPAFVSEMRDISRYESPAHQPRPPRVARAAGYRAFDAKGRAEALKESYLDDILARTLGKGGRPEH